ncbi:TetR/AcrR family transcriptional regulator [Amycolatopsis sp. NPDC059657]|uniref:TetR/AcrR family transcriptional regulator n=1 Tax=Amycolatopsis sp. NPDC059657 TaxID=3346899 RepID=UPI0036719EF2
MTDRAAARSEELIAAAYKVFSTQGYRTTGVADIVREAGVSHGTFYNYYDSKRHILDAVLDHAVGKIIVGVIGSDAPAEATTLDELSDQFRAILTRLFAVIEEQPGLIEFLMLDAPAIDGEMITRLLELTSSFGTLAMGYLENGVRRGFLDPNLDTKIAGESLLALMISAVVSTMGGSLRPADRDAQIEALVEFAYHGMAAV